MKTVKKAVALLLAALTVSMALPAGSFSVSAENTTDFLGGDGTQGNPYLISDKAHLNNVRAYPDAYFLIVVDIVFSAADFAAGGAFYNDGQGWEPIGASEGSAFTGTFDGDGHTITGLVCNRTGAESVYAGLFGYNKGSIQNLGMIDAHLNARTTSPSDSVYVGGISGYNDRTIANCYNTGNIISNSFNDHANAGGIAGYNNGTIINCYNTGMVSSVSAFYYAGGGIAGINYGTIKSCYNTGNITAEVISVETGGIAGYSFDTGIISNCYNIGEISAQSSTDAYNGLCDAGGIAGYKSSKSVISNCYSVGNITAGAAGTKAASPHAGGIVGYSQSGDEKSIINCYYWGRADHGIGGGGRDNIVKCTFEQMKQSSVLIGFDFDTVWKFVNETVYPFPVLQDVPHVEGININKDIGFLDGIGTKEKPYLISTKLHLDNVRNHPDAHFKMAADIAFTEADFAEGGEFYNGGQGWEPIGSNESSAFMGTIDGDGHTITGLVCNRTGAESVYAGLFGYNKGRILNLVMENCSVSAVAESDSGLASAGSIAGVNSGTVYNCSNIGGMSASSGKSSSEAGGIAGRVNEYGKISSCYNTGHVSASIAMTESAFAGAGGITGLNYGTIDNCYNTGNINGRTAGGIAGLTSRFYPNNGTITNCYNTGRVTASAASAGSGEIAGNNEPNTIIHCYYLDDTAENTHENTNSSVPCTAEKMKQQATFIDFDFTSVWEIDGYRAYPYPQLKSNRQEPIQSIELLTSPHNGQAVEGLLLLSDLSGATVKITYADGFEITVDATTQMLSELDVNQIGVQTIHLTYGGQVTDGTIDMEVIPKSIASIASIASVNVTTSPNKTAYVQGQALNPAGGRLTISYKNNTNETIDLSEARLSYPLDQTGAVTATAEYHGFTAEFSVTINEKTVQSISVVEPAKLTYVEGQQLDLTGGRLQVTYVSDDNYTEEIPLGWGTISGYKPNQLGSQSLTVTYGGRRDSFIVTVVAKTLTRIEVTTKPDKLTYIEGQTFAAFGMAVTAYYDNDTTENISWIICDISTDDFSTPGTKTITVSYAGKTASFEVEVVAKSLSGIAVYTLPAKQSYLEGKDALDVTGGQLSLNYNNDTVEIIDLTPDMVSGFDNTKIGTKTLTVSYGGKKTTFTVEIVSKTLTKIEVTKKPDKLAYIEGQAFDSTGAVVSAYYDNDTSEAVTDYAVFGGYDPTPGTKTIIVSYGGFSDSFTVEVEAKSLVSINVTTLPAKQNYIEGQAFDPSGMEVTAFYNNDTSEGVTGYDISGYTSTPGKKTITVTYNGKTAAFEVTVYGKSLTRIEITRHPDKIAYLEGDRFDATGLEVTAYYNNGTSEVVTDYTISGYTATPGTKTITVSYNSIAAAFEVSVAAKSLTEINVTRQPNKTVYLEGAEFDLTGLEVTAYYNNGTSEVVMDYTISGYNPMPGTKTITVAYGGKTVAFTVTVNAKALISIAVTKSPDKMTYVERTLLDTAGMQLTLTYDNGTSEVLATGWKEEYDFSSPGQQPVKITYGGKSIIMTVTVVAKTLSGITVAKLPDKLTYLEGEAFDPAGLEVTARYNNDTSETVTGRVTIQGYTSTPGVKRMTVSFGGKYAEFTVTVKAKSVVSVEWKSKPSKTSYWVGEALSLSGAIILVRYDNGVIEEKTLQGTWGADQYNPNKTGQQTISISYGEAPPISFTVTVNPHAPGSMTSGSYAISGGYISKIGAGATVSQLLEGINEKTYCKVYKGSAETAVNTLLGTGMTVCLLDGSTVRQTLTIVVTGDTNGDGGITITDMLAVKSHLLKKSTLSGAAAKAADTSGDKAISITDFIQIKAHILGKDKIRPSAC